MRVGGRAARWRHLMNRCSLTTLTVVAPNCKSSRSAATWPYHVTKCANTSDLKGSSPRFPDAGGYQLVRVMAAERELGGLTRLDLTYAFRKELPCEDSPRFMAR